MSFEYKEFADGKFIWREYNDDRTQYRLHYLEKSQVPDFWSPGNNPPAEAAHWYDWEPVR